MASTACSLRTPGVALTSLLLSSEVLFDKNAGAFVSISEFAAETPTEKWEPMFRALGMLIISRCCTHDSLQEK